MDRSYFTEICKASYAECKDFWEFDAEPTMPEDFEISGKSSKLSSIETVTFIASIEERLFSDGIEISLIDHFLEIENSSITVDVIYKILEQCIA